MSVLPVIVGFGGINAAGRSSGFHSYKRMICDILSPEAMQTTWQDLAWRMNIPISERATEKEIAQLKAGTLIRKIDHFDSDHVPYYFSAKLDGPQTSSSFIVHKSKLPENIPPHWEVQALENQEFKITLSHPSEILVPATMRLKVRSAGNIPAGFDPGALYNSHHHPRALKLAVYGASDALNSLGMEWEDILRHIRPDEVSVYAGSALGQIDNDSLGGVFNRFLTGNRISSKMIPLSLAEMPADFINGYVINNVGNTGANLGACASFLYNLRQGILDIQTKKAKIAIIGGAEAPIVPEAIEAFNAMGALASDELLCALDNSSEVDHRRACRPFSTNAGFTLAEGSQFLVLMEDELALKLGLTIYGSVGDVFISADANKKSISKPGIGNYLTVAKAVSLAKAILGQSGLNSTYVSAHGTGTPQNRTSESHILNEMAKTFSIKAWPVTAIKSYIGHTVSAAAGDQILSALGAWQHGWIPGIKTIDHIAEDVHRSNLHILTDHYALANQDMAGVFINSKGFGGNNATAFILSPKESMAMLSNKYGKSLLHNYYEKNQKIQANSQAKDLKTCEGEEKITYKFGESLLSETDIALSTQEVRLPGFAETIQLPLDNPYEEYK